MKTLLTAIDFSPITQKVVDGGAELASALNAKLVLLNVVEPIAAYVPVGAAMDDITAPITVEPPDLEAVKERLEQLAQPLRARESRSRRWPPWPSPRRKSWRRQRPSVPPC